MLTSPVRRAPDVLTDTAVPYLVPSGVRSPLAPSLSLDTTSAWHLARRVAQAPTAAMVADIERQGLSTWLHRQFSPQDVPDPLWDAVKGRWFDWLDLDQAQLRARYGGNPSFVGGALCQALVHRPVFTSRVLLDSVVAVLGDHVYVPVLSKASPYVIHFEREVLGRHALGRYEDLLLAAVSSPALLTLLDNVYNLASAPNENLGRELLELYTVGVGAFQEKDVAQSARILTGLGVDDATGTFVMRGAAHTAGPVTVMGFSHPNPPVAGSSGTVPDVVRQYVRYLAHHPATARRVARLFAVHFVSDDPSDALVSALAQSYLDNDTRIENMLRALFVHPEFWGSVGAKWSRPREVIGRARRVLAPTDYRPASPLGTDAWKMGVTPWWYDAAGDLPRYWPGVDGYPDVAEAWAGTSTMLSTWNAVSGVVRHWDSVTADPDWAAVLGLAPGVSAGDAARSITFALTGYHWSAPHVATIAAILSRDGAPTATLADRLTNDNLVWNLRDAVHMVLASPYAFLR